MSGRFELVSVLACPRCDHAPLTAAEGRHRCDACRIDFPTLDGIPWLFAEPSASLGEWRSRADFTMQTLAHEQRRLQAAASAGDVSDLTRRRLTKHAEATRAHAEHLGTLLAPLKLEPLTASFATNLAFRTRVPSDQGLMKYAYNIHRDWSWGKDENEASFAIVREALAGASPGKTLVLGAGAGRLAYDVHTRTDSQATVVVDFNPFLLFLARRITTGETVELYEFPLAPKSIDDHAVLRKLEAEQPCRDGLHYVLADAHRPPFVKGGFDTVLTPWLVDILPERFGTLCKRINALLSDGGRWINFGSLSFHVGDPALQYSKEECAEIIAETGFDAPVFSETSMPYLCSPASRHGRHEQVLGWTADKQRDVPKAPRHKALPDWLVLGKDPVPLLDSFHLTAESTRVRAYILSLIDGRRSLDDIVAVFDQQKLMTHEEAEATIRELLIRLYESSRRR